jgi:hypothetical protein
MNYSHIYIMNVPNRIQEAKIIKKLFERSGDKQIIINTDDVKAGPFANQRAILERSKTECPESEFIIIAHDDICFALDILTSISTILKAAPKDNFINFYCTSNAGFHKAINSGKHIYKTKSNFWMPLHAFPTSLIDDYLMHTDQTCPVDYICEDMRIRKFCRDQNVCWYNVIPSLSQHLGAYRSELGNNGKVFKVVRNSDSFEPDFDVESIDWKKEFADPFVNIEPLGFIPFDGWQKGMDLDKWNIKTGELQKIKK